MARELTERESDGLLTVRLVMSRVAEQDGERRPDLDGDPGRVATVADGVLFAYPDVAYGIVERAGDGRVDLVYETRVLNGRFRSRLYTRTGRLVLDETVDPRVASARISERVFGRPPTGEPSWN